MSGKSIADLSSDSRLPVLEKRIIDAVETIFPINSKIFITLVDKSSDVGTVTGYKKYRPNDNDFRVYVVYKSSRFNNIKVLSVFNLEGIGEFNTEYDKQVRVAADFVDVY